jgi:hypothetical protein
MEPNEKKVPNILRFPDEILEKFYSLFLPITDYFEIDEIKKLVENMHTISQDTNDFTLGVRSIRKINPNLNEAYTKR